jgi:hypothetical protein
VILYEPHASKSFTTFSDLLDDNQRGSRQSSNTEYYLFDLLTAITNREDSPPYAELDTLDIATFERRFGRCRGRAKVPWEVSSSLDKQHTSCKAPPQKLSFPCNPFTQSPVLAHPVLCFRRPYAICSSVLAGHDVSLSCARCTGLCQQSSQGLAVLWR